MCLLVVPYDRCYIILPCYLHSIYIVFTYFAYFTGYEDDRFEVISNLHFQWSKFGEKYIFLIELCGVQLVFSSSSSLIPLTTFNLVQQPVQIYKVMARICIIEDFCWTNLSKRSTLLSITPDYLKLKIIYMWCCIKYPGSYW